MVPGVVSKMTTLTHGLEVGWLAVLRNVVEVGYRKNHDALGPYRRLAMPLETAPRDRPARLTVARRRLM